MRLAPTPVIPARRRKSRRVVDRSAGFLDDELTASLDDEPVAWLDTGKPPGLFCGVHSTIRIRRQTSLNRAANNTEFAAVRSFQPRPAHRVIFHVA